MLNNAPMMKDYNLAIVFLVFSSIVGGGNLTAADSAVIQWKNPTQGQPWLSRLEVVPHSENVALQAVKLDRLDPDYPNGVRIIFTKQGEEAGWIRIRLGQGYGFLISDHMLDRHLYLWVRDKGSINSRQWLDFDSKSEWVEFPGSLKTADVVVRFWATVWIQAKDANELAILLLRK
jgi:hypothetical protein